METDQSDSCAMSLAVKLMSGEVDRPFIGSRVASFSQKMMYSAASTLLATCLTLSSSFVFVSHLE